MLVSIKQITDTLAQYLITYRDTDNDDKEIYRFNSMLTFIAVKEVSKWTLYHIQSKDFDWKKEVEIPMVIDKITFQKQEQILPYIQALLVAREI